MSDTTLPIATGAPPTARIYRRLLANTALSAVPLAVGLPLLFKVMLSLDGEQTRFIAVSFVAAAMLTFAMMAIGARFGFRDVAGSAQNDQNARLRILRLPARLAGITLVAGSASTLMAAFARTVIAHDPPSLVIGVALTSLALAVALAVPVYAAVRGALEPHAEYFASPSLPEGKRTSLGLVTGYTILAIAAIALIPAAVFGNARLVRARATEIAERCGATARRLARVTATMSQVEALRFIANQDLEHARTAVRLPSGNIEPIEFQPASSREVAQEAPLVGELRGGAVIVISQPQISSGATLLLVVSVLEALVALVALSLARALRRDARAVTAQVDALADERDPPKSVTMATAEMRRLSLALNRLLERIPRLQVEKYLAVEQAEESRRLKSMFLANMSHDLRSPLNSILGFSELLVRGLEGPITDDQKKLLEDVHETGSYLLRLLSEILDTARAESGHLDLDRKPVPPTTLVTQASKEALRGRPERIADKLEIDLQAGMQPAHVDALRMQQALMHAMNWAIEVAHGGKVHVEVAERARPRGRALIVEIWCDGKTSIEEEAQLFQPFRKVEGVPGLHLALPLAKRFVEAHGGQMEAYGGQRPGVRIILPVVTTTRPPIAERRRV